MPQADGDQGIRALSGSIGIASLQPIRPLTPRRLVLALVSTVVATFATSLFMDLLLKNVFLLFLVAILMSALGGGLWAGLIATAGSCLGAAIVVFPPIGSLRVESRFDLVRIGALAFFGPLISVLAQALRAARKRAEQQAAEARAGEESFRTLFDNTADGIFVLDPDGTMLNVNQAAADQQGRPREAMIGHTWQDFADPQLNDLPALWATFDEILDGDNRTMQVWARHASGRPIPLEMRVSKTRYFGKPAVLAISRDLTERHRLESQLRQSQKMDAIGRLAGGVAHDFNNLLTTIRGYASLMRDRLAHDPTLLEDLAEIERAVDLASAVTVQLLAFSRKQDYRPRLASLNDSLERMESLLRRLLGERVELAVELEPDLGLAMLDDGQVEQIVMNLVVNARDALPGGNGRIVIRTRNVEVGTPPAAYVAVTVSDTGSGMDEPTRSRIFEPFFTTKEAGHGTGLGLSTVYGIVNQSGGTIEVESAPGMGSTFVVMFPRVDTPLKPRPASAGRPQAEGASEAGAAASTSPLESKMPERTVLLADDETPVRQLVRRILTRRGYTVIEASNGQEALDIAMSVGRPIDALVTDVVMPGLTGPELAERLRERWPDLPILFTSGYNEEGVEGTGVVSGLGIAFLQKPFVPEELLRLVSELLPPAKS